MLKCCRPDAAPPPPSLLANEGLVQPANERPVCCADRIWITRAVGRVRTQAYLALACQMRWTGEVSIIITLDWEKPRRVVKLCMTFESRPECILTLFWAIYDSVLIQCMYSACKPSCFPSLALLTLVSPPFSALYTVQCVQRVNLAVSLLWPVLMLGSPPRLFSPL